MMKDIDVALQSLYIEFDTPADQLLASVELANAFLDSLTKRLGTSLDREVVLRRLLTLRKKGRLARLRRN